MARLVKKGIDYMPFDANFFSDIKIRRLIRCKGMTGVGVYLDIVCEIYKQGYYLDVDEDTAFDISETSHLDEDEVKDIINTCFALNLFSQSLYETEHVLTSEGIQRRYQQICKESKRVFDMKEHNLIDISPEEMPISSEEIPAFEEEIPGNGIQEGINSKNSELIPQRKVKKSKVKNSSSLSSPFVEEAEKEKQEILLKFFFERNFLAPQAELRKMMRWNNRPGSPGWDKMNLTEMQAAADMWQQLDENKQPVPAKRFDDKFLAIWKELYQEALSRGAPAQVLRDMLGDDIRWKFWHDVYGNEADSWRLVCSKALKAYLEESRSWTLPIFRKVISDQRMQIYVADG